MILSVHALFGAAVASLVPTHPVVGFALGFASHLALDAIPHRDYDLISFDQDPNRKMQFVAGPDIKFRFIRDIILISFDAIFGIILAYLFFFNSAHPWIFLIGATGGMMPDFLTILYVFWKYKYLVLFFKFHSNVIHSRLPQSLNQVIAIILQFGVIAVLIAIIYGLKYYF